MPTISNGEVVSSVTAKLNDTINKVEGVTPFNNDLSVTGNVSIDGGLVVDGLIEAYAFENEGGQLELKNPGNSTTGLYVDVVSANRGRIFQVANNSRIDIGQLGGTGGSVSTYVGGVETLLVKSVNSAVQIAKSGSDWYNNSHLELLSTAGNVTLGFHAAGATAVNIRHVRSTNELQVTNYNSSAYAPIQASAFLVNSDYRLKENVVPLENAIDRLLQLPVYQFNFVQGSMLYDEGKPVDGFLAHEVQEVVPEAASGVKDGLNAEGNPVYQSIDQSKLVPLLTAALQEALAKIEALEARVAALEV